MIINEIKEENEDKKLASLFKRRELFLVDKRPCLIIDYVVQGKINENQSYKIWFALEDIFSEKTIDKIYKSDEYLTVPKINNSQWELVSLLETGYAVLAEINNNKIQREDVQLPSDNNLFYKMKRSKIKFPDKKHIVEVINYGNLNKIIAIKVEI